MDTTGSRRRTERGTTMVETALSLLWFLAFVFGVMEAGRFLNVQVTLTNAAREGARYAVLPLRGTDTLPGADAVQAQVAGFLRANSMDPAMAAVTVTPSSVGGTTYVEVVVAAPYNMITPNLDSAVPGWTRFANLVLSGHSLMRNETSSR